MPSLPDVVRPTLARLIACLALMLPAAAPAAAADAPGVGIAAIRVTDPVSRQPADGFVFYPSSQATPGPIMIGPYPVAARFDAPPLPGAKPLVAISHGNGGSNLGHHDLATYLASHGFVVVTINQLGDYFRDTSKVGHIEMFAGRPVQLQAAITYLLDDPQWKPLIDPARIGVAGFSAGGYTALMLAGARPRFDRFISFCDQHPDVQDVCDPRAELEAEARRQGQTLEQFFHRVQEQLGIYGNTADPRIKAAFAMAPLSLLFHEHSFDQVNIPVFLYYGQNDHVLLPDFNAKHIAPLIRHLYAIKEIPHADHWVFLPPCSPALAKDIPAMCQDPPGVDRSHWHRQINADALAFFRQTLGVTGQQQRGQ